MSEKHPNSKEVTIHRAPSFLEKAQGPEAAMYMDGARIAIGSYFTSGDSPRIASGFEFWQEDILMPNLVEVPAHDSQFRKAVKAYFTDIDTKVPPKGRTFEIGMTDDNTKPLKQPDEKGKGGNMPINLVDYILYHHAIGHPHVALEEEETYGNPRIQFYVFNPHKKIEARAKLNDTKDSAISIFASLKEDESKVDQMIIMMGYDPREFAGKGDKQKAEKRQIALRDMVDQDPARFKQVHEEGDLEERAWLEKLVSTGVITRFGDRYQNGETKTLIAQSYAELLYWIKDEEKEGEISLLKGLAQEKLAAAYRKPTKKVTAR